MTVLHHFDDSDSALLDILTGPDPKVAFARRDAALDPLLIAAATASGPHVTRNHYHHDFFPGVRLPQTQATRDLSKYTPEDASSRNTRKRLAYVSRQAPRRQRLEEGKENNHPLQTDPLKSGDLPGPKKRRMSLVNSDIKHRPQKSQANSESVPRPIQLSTPPLEVQCMARTRIPTPHGPAFLHLYHNTRDSKEHLAIVIDPAQLSETLDHHIVAPSIRSKSLDAIWTETETEMDRIVRGAYVGRLSSTLQHASNPLLQYSTMNQEFVIPPPLIRIHSECFTGETVGSMRCDCGEQLDEAIRQISQPIILSSNPPTAIPGRGAIIYLRQEGRGIGLLSKIRAYNLQDMGHDTVTANLMLGHKADERGYEVAAAILRDLSLGSGTLSSKLEGVRVLTNNPDKVEALEKEGIQVAERVSMIPRSWQHRKMVTDTNTLMDDAQGSSYTTVAGATLIGGNAVYGEDLDKYLRTKVIRMGHILPL